MFIYKANSEKQEQLTGVYPQDIEEAGYALLRGNGWNYYMRKLYCIIGRQPIKYGVLLNTEVSEDIDFLALMTARAQKI